MPAASLPFRPASLAMFRGMGSYPHPTAEQALRRLLDKVESDESKSDEQDITEPRVEADKPGALKNAGVVDHVPQIEVEQV